MKRHFIFIFLLVAAYRADAQKVTGFPSFQLDFPYPTADKPQSKLWFMDSCWWALLPTASGPSLWKRGNSGWKEHPEIRNALKNIPGRADVWYDNRMVTAIGVSDSSLHIFRLAPGAGSDASWKAETLAILRLPQKDRHIETATIVQDTAGVWWIAADVGTAIYVWHAEDAVQWSNPVRIGENISDDDISCITALKDKVIVTWSDQVGDAVHYREHMNEDTPGKWSPITAVESGNNTADDHLHTAVSDDGTLWLATKNSLDEITLPQLVLRVRTPSGVWNNYPYLAREDVTEPSRPVVVTASGSNVVLAGHTIYNKNDRNAGSIVFGMIDTTSKEILVKQTVVIIPDPSLKAMINDITVPKHAFPPDAPWLILASDKHGNVYEADLKPFFH
ncbi:MAG: hypothetical protein KIT80_03425 [Chitinophagaceae bacterium]|nr:hypothetical protein [Chitinophagaceae bacterium]MCW5925937.1 hypothetical protein [Chitinophagaceae bacterium]